MTGAWKIMQHANSKNIQNTELLREKLEDQKQALICEEHQKREMMIKRLCIIKQNVVKTQNKAASQAKLIHKFNMQKIGCKNQTQTQKMYMDLFQNTSNKNLSTENSIFLGTKNLTKYIKENVNKKTLKKSTFFPIYFDNFQKKTSKIFF